jgi:outer membrane receptor for ferrienterochelin and colicins
MFDPIATIDSILILMRLIIVLLAITIATTLSGQTTPHMVRILVKDNSGPVAGARVMIAGSSGITSADGIILLAVTESSAEVEISKAEHQTVHSHISFEPDQREAQIEVELPSKLEEQEEVTVYATRTNVRLQDSPLHVEVLSQDDIDEELAMRPGDISMMLNEMGGMRVQTTSPGLGVSSVRVQGMRGRYTAFLSDGLPLFGQSGAGLGLLQIPPMDLRQLEIIKGNASALYGSAAMAGVVNLISRRPAEKPIREFLINRTSLDATDGSMFLGQKFTSHFGGTFRGGGFAQDASDRNKDNWADVAAYQRGVIRPRLFWDDKQGNTAMLTGGFVYEDRSGGTLPGAVLPATGQRYREALLSRRYDLGGELQRLFANRYVLMARFAASDQEHRHEFGQDDIEHDRHDLLFGELSIRGGSSKNTWVAGVADMWDAYRPHDVPRFAYTFNAPGLIAQDDLTLTSWLSLSGSARLDFHNVYGTFFSPRISALVRKSGWTSRLSVGQGFFASTPLTEETEAAGLAKLQQSGSLRSERGRTASADLTQTLGPISLTGTLFASAIDRPVFVDRNAAYQIFNLSGPTRNYGTELLGTWRKAPFTVTGTYTYVRTSELEPVVGRMEVPLTPRHNLGVVGMWEKEGTTKIGLECYYIGRQHLEYNPYRDISVPYVLFGALVEHKVASHVKLFINAENLGDIRQTKYDPLLLPSREADGRWTVDAWAPLDGRVVNGGVRFSF